MKYLHFEILNRQEPTASRSGSCCADLLFYKTTKDGSFTFFKNEEITELANNLNYFFVKNKQEKAVFLSKKGFFIVKKYKYYWSRFGHHEMAPETQLFNYLNKIYILN